MKGLFRINCFLFGMNSMIFIFSGNLFALACAGLAAVSAYTCTKSDFS